MKKIKNKFLLLQIDCALDDVAMHLNNNQFNENNGVGIISRKLSNGRITATFAERKNIYEEIAYPNGETGKFERIKYVYFDFKVRLINDNYYLFQLFSPPLSLRAFVLYLSEILPGLAIEKFKLDLFAFRQSLIEQNSFNNVRVTSLKASSLPFSNKSIAKIEIFSEVDAFDELKKAYGEKGYDIDRMVFTINNHGLDLELSSSSVGSIFFVESLNEDVIIDSFSRSIKY